MARSKVKIKLNGGTVSDLLRSSAMQADLAGRAQAIAAQAGEGFESGVSDTGSRARAAVWTATWEAKRAEAERRVLTSAIGAGR